LWCCVRDYKKGLYNKIFSDAIKEVKEVSNDHSNELLDIWNNLPMNQIELPGDVWNNSPLFRDNLFANVLDLNTIPKTWNMPKIIREIYNQLKNDEDIEDFYPEQFDITFDFVPRMCNKKLCNLTLLDFLSFCLLFPFLNFRHVAHGPHSPGRGLQDKGHGLTSSA